MEFQAEKPKIHKLHNKMVSFYKILLWNYLKRNYVNSTNIDIVNPKHLNNYLSIEDIYLGPKAQLIIENESHQIPTSDTACYGNLNGDRTHQNKSLLYLSTIFSKNPSKPK
jgi:hypothetical protein